MGGIANPSREVESHSDVGQGPKQDTNLDGSNI